MRLQTTLKILLATLFSLALQTQGHATTCKDQLTKPSTAYTPTPEQAIEAFQAYLQSRHEDYESYKNHIPIENRDWNYEIGDFARVPISHVKNRIELTSRELGSGRLWIIDPGRFETKRYDYTNEATLEREWRATLMALDPKNAKSKSSPSDILWF